MIIMRFLILVIMCEGVEQVVGGGGGDGGGWWAAACARRGSGGGGGGGAARRHGVGCFSGAISRCELCYLN